MYEISFALLSELVLRKTSHVNFPRLPPATFEESKMVNFQDKNACRLDSSGGSWGGARGPSPPPPPPLILDQTEARGAQKCFFETAPPPIIIRTPIISAISH